jgi:hypothetical protein
MFSQGKTQNTLPRKKSALGLFRKGKPPLFLSDQGFHSGAISRTFKKTAGAVSLPGEFNVSLPDTGEHFCEGHSITPNVKHINRRLKLQNQV